jgi:hypothetical protein
MRAENSSLRRLEFMPRNLDKKCHSKIPSIDHRESNNGSNIKKEISFFHELQWGHTIVITPAKLLSF